MVEIGRRVGLFSVISIVLLFAVFYAHMFLLAERDLRFNLVSVYIFFYVVALIIYILLEFINWKVPSQTGFLFLATVFLKMGFFVLVFKNDLFQETQLALYERISIMIPLTLSLILEAAGCFKLLNKD